MLENSQTFPLLPSNIFSQFRYQTKRIIFPSLFLQRNVFLDLVYPSQKLFHYGDCSFLFLNDGQDLKALSFLKILEEMGRHQKVFNIVTIAIYAGDRIQEYGVSGVPDYAGRGSLAGQYHKFLSKELFPFIENFFKLKINPDKTAITGFSLGGLSAFDFAWEHSERVSKVGVFSGSFWWRTCALGPDYKESDRIMHHKVSKSTGKPPLKFWFQAGTLDEESDRNQNGIIDSIDDTLDLISVLHNKGYLDLQDIVYQEVEGGMHNHGTWSRLMPLFLEWAFALNLPS